MVHSKGYGENAISVECPHCGETNLHDPQGDGEIVRGSRCRACEDWYTVFDDREDV